MLVISKKLIVVISIALVVIEEVQSIAPLIVASGFGEIAGGITAGWDLVSKGGDITKLNADDHQELLGRFDDISNQIRESNEKNKELAHWTVKSILDYLKYDKALEDKLAAIKKLKNTISHHNRTTYAYLKAFKVGGPITFAQLNNVNNIKDSVNNLAFEFVGSIDDDKAPDDSALSLLATVAERTKEKLCDRQQSAQQLLQSFYYDITISQLKGYVAAQFSLMFCGGNSQQESEILRNSFETLLRDSQRKVTQVLHRMERIIWRCDPAKYKEGETYEQVTGFMQGYIQNEMHMTDPGSLCKGTCENIQSTKTGCNSEYTEHHFCSQGNDCHGKKHSCEYFVYDTFKYCVGGEKDKVARYSGIKYQDKSFTSDGMDKKIGKVNYCPSTQRHLMGKPTWKLYYCEFCYCLCDSNAGQHQFSTIPAESDIDKNMVVTGVRLRRTGDVFQLQIQQGKLGELGYINPDTLQWVDIIKENGNYPNYNMNVDKRSIDLDEVVFDDSTPDKDPESVVTGVKFTDEKGHLQVNIRVTKFNFATGQLSQSSEWKKPSPPNNKALIKLNRPEISILTNAKSLPTSKNNQYIKFQNTDKEKDVGQHAVPYLDIQEVVSDPPTPLSGVGIYHKGTNEYGGFIAPKLITLNYAPATSYAVNKITGKLA